MIEKQIRINGFGSDDACVRFNHLGQHEKKYNVRISWKNLTIYETDMNLTNNDTIGYYVGFNKSIKDTIDNFDITFTTDSYEETHNVVISDNQQFDDLNNIVTNIKDCSYYTYNEIFVKGIYDDRLVIINENDVVVDIGANYGFFSLYAQKFNPEKIIAFEPSYSVFSCLSQNVENISLFQKAVSGNNGTCNFVDIENSSASSCISQNGKGYDVEVIGINNLISFLGLEKIDYLKLDCEGSEKEIFEVINQDTLNKINKIVVEYHSEEIKDIIKNKLEHSGFKIEKDSDSILFCYNIEYFKKKKKVALISTYCDTEEKRNILLDNVKKLKKLNIDVIALSPLPLPEEIVGACDYFYYTKENPILKWPVRLFTFWHQFQLQNGNICTFHRGVGDYGWAALYHVKKLTQIMMPYDYDIYYHMIYDLEIDECVENAILNFEGNIVYPRRDPHHPETLWETTLHFMSFDKDLMKKIEKEITLDSYLSTNGVAEGEVFKWKNKFKISSSEHPVKDKIFYWKDYNFFNYSPVPDFKMFLSKNEEMTIWLGENPPQSSILTQNIRICFYGFQTLEPILLKINNQKYTVEPKNYEFIEFPISSQSITSLTMEYKNQEYDLTGTYSDIMLNQIFYNRRD